MILRNFYESYYKKIMFHSIDKEPIPFSDFLAAGFSTHDFSEYIGILAEIYGAVVQYGKIDSSLRGQKKLITLLEKKGLIAREYADELLSNKYILAVSKRDVLHYVDGLYFPRSIDEFRYRVEIKLSKIDFSIKYLERTYNICIAANSAGDDILKRKCSDGELRLLTDDDFSTLCLMLEDEQSHLHQQRNHMKVKINEAFKRNDISECKHLGELYEQLIETLTLVNQSYDKIVSFKNNYQSNNTDSLSKFTKNDQLFVNIGKNRCLTKEHIQKDKIILIQCPDREYRQLAVTRCLDCLHHTIDIEGFTDFCTKYGVPSVQIVYIENGITVQDVNGQSFVSDYRKLGYTTGQDAGLSDKQRQEILENIIKRGIKTKSETRRFLKFLISVNGKKSVNQYAVQKWENDLKFIESLNYL